MKGSSSVQLRGPDCGHGYTAYNGRHPDGSECGYAVARAFGLYHGSDDAVSAGRTYGSNGRRYSRAGLASKSRAVLAVALIAFVLGVVAWIVVSANFVDPPAFVPQPTPTPSPGDAVPDAGMRPVVGS